MMGGASSSSVYGIASSVRATCDGPQRFTLVPAYNVWLEVVICANSRTPVQPEYCPDLLPVPEVDGGDDEEDTPDANCTGLACIVAGVAAALACFA